jgi:two-component system, cell cycle sensor histidine kinase and response regulator CckA
LRNDRRVGCVHEPRPPFGQSLEESLETILVVDDHDLIREMLAAALTNSGYQVVTAKTGVEALSVSALHSGAIQLLLTDLEMPGMKGADLAERLRSCRPQIQVLFMSGFSEALVGPDLNFIPKPFNLAVLAERIRTILAMSRA